MTFPRPDRRARLVAAVVLAGSAVGCGIVALVGPANVNRATFEWSAADDPPHVPLVLSASRPQSIEVEVPCDVARRPGPVRQLFTTSLLGRGLVVAAGDRVVRVHVAGSGEVLSLPVLGTRRCDAEVRFGIEHGLLRLTVGSASTKTHLERDSQPIVTGLLADRGILGSGLSARLVTQPTGSSPSTRQLLATVGAAACVVAASVLLLLGTAPNSVRRRWLRTPVLVWADGAVAVVALTSVVLTPASYDDGWVLATVRQFADLGRFSTYYGTEASSLVQGGWWDALLYPFMSATSNVVVLRLLFAGVTLLTWWVVRRWILDQWSDVPACRRSARFAAAATAILVVPAWMTTLRPEPLIALMAAIAMAATIRFRDHPGPAPLLAALVASALALTTHQTGWVVVAGAAPVILFLEAWLRHDRVERLLTLAVIILGTASVGLLLFAFDTDLSLIRSDAGDFVTHELYGYGPFDEWRRPHSAITFHSTVRVAAMLVPFLGFVAVLVARPRSTDLSAQRVAVWCSVAGYLGLMLTTSKLVWHYGAVMPFSLVLVAAGFQRIAADASSWAPLKRGLAAVCVVLVGAYSFSRSRGAGETLGWNELDLVSTEWSDLHEIGLLGGLDLSRPIVWLVGLALVAGLLVGFRAWKHRRGDVTSAVLGVTLAAVCLVPVGLTWSLLIGDARSADGWSFTGQLLDSAFGGEHCGLAQELPVVASGVQLVHASGTDDLPRAVEGGYLHFSTNAVLPIAGIETWGTRSLATGTPNPDLVTGRFATPWYELAGEDELAFWTVGRTGAGNRITIETRTSGGAVAVSPIDRETDALYWSINRVPALPRDALAVRLVLQDNSLDGSLATTALASVTYEPFAATLSKGERVWVEPQYHLYAPCVDLPSISDGYVHPFSASLVSIPLRETAEALIREAAFVETGCNAAGACAYRVEFADPAFLRER